MAAWRGKAHDLKSYLSSDSAALQTYKMLRCLSSSSPSSSLITGFLPSGTSPLDPMVHSTTQASSFRLWHFPYYVRCPGTAVSVQNTLNAFLILFPDIKSLVKIPEFPAIIGTTKHFIIHIHGISLLRFLHF
jgi:hypothetical protein